MRTDSRLVGGPELLIVVGACVFIAMLGLSAYFVADLRWLHFFQAWIYLGTMALSFRRNRWGYFIGISAAGYWDYVGVFVMPVLRNGVHWLGASLATGKIQHIDQIMVAVPPWIGNFLVLVGCIWGFGRLQEKSLRDLARFVLAFVLTTAFLVADVAVFSPGRLPIFRRSLHPHVPFAVAISTPLIGVKSPYH